MKKISIWRRRIVRWWVVLCLGSATTVWGTESNLLDQAELLLKQDQAGQALQLLAPEEIQRAGQVDYDYLLGVAYLANNLPEPASFALERVVAQNPRHAAAWLDLGRAYLMMGDHIRAKAVFDTILDLQPPPAARATVMRHLAALERPSDSGSYVFNGFVDAALGWDSNINTSPRQDLMTVPALGGLQVKLNPKNVKMRDRYGRFTAGGDASILLTGTLRSVSSVRTNFKRFRHSPEFHTDDAEVRTGLQYGFRDSLVVINAIGQWATLGPQLNRRSWGGNIDWWQRLNTNHHLLFSNQLMRHQYPAPWLADNNFDQQASSLSWIYSPDSQRWQWASQVFGAREVGAADRTDGNARLSGVRFQGVWRDTVDTEWYLVAGALRGQYDRANPAFLINRKDRQWSVGAGVAWKATKSTSVQLRWDYIARHSNIPISEYARHDVGVSVRYDFR
ncbi:hypothetical protein HNQ59_002955 [Chitinivorax tropicus]|uniref:Surface lipoprotein assembly modifier C-terminal domain-containing protein n=1 Tax=Chitinivorax tropicus TaxID=714531 RepID=A0A840MRB8_9PROT|nr:tetratricopeptide repeat protein [Chitinivorax tropicus]MBB5019647.1 hypothetical protein [Chitinivorax tropicus]